MRNTSITRNPAVLAAAVTLLSGMAVSPAMAQVTATPPATTPATPVAPASPPPNYKVQYNGLVDGYYMYDFVDPHSSALQDGNVLPTDNSYAVRTNTPTLALAELNVFQLPKPNGFGWKATLQTGDTTDVDHFSWPPGVNSSEARYKNIQQLYGTVAIGGNGAGVDFGKFYTPYGYEVVEANQDYNYTRSLPFFFLPVYHVGIRAYTPNIKGFTLTGYVVNAIFNTATAGVSDDNGSKDFIGTINYTDPKGKWDFITSDGGGSDKFNADPDNDNTKSSKIFLSDNDFTYNFTSTVLAGLNYEYGKFDSSTGDSSAESGYAGYLKDQFNPKEAVAVRYSAEDVTFDNSETALKPNEITFTLEDKITSAFTTRLEYRHDSVNSGNEANAAFLSSSGMSNKTSQDLVIVGGMFTFP